MSSQGDRSPPPPTGPSPNPSPPPLWEDAVKGGMEYRLLKSGCTYEYRCKSYLGHFAVKLALTILIPRALEGHTMTCFDATREMLLSFDIAFIMLARSSLKGLTISDFYWAWEDLYNRYSLDIFTKIAGTFYGQIWGLARKRLEDQGFRNLPAQFKTPWLRYRLLLDLLAEYPASEGPSTPFIVEHGKVKISIPARSSPSTTTSTTLFITTEEIPDIQYKALPEEERVHLRDCLIDTACTAISHRNNAAKNWNLFPVDSKKREFSMSVKELQGKAWVGDAILHRLSREVLTEVRPALPLGCIRAVAKTFNSNPVQAAFARRCGWYKNPRYLCRVKADHLGGTFVEGASCLSVEANCRDNMASAKVWVKGSLECVARPLVQAFRYFFRGSVVNRPLNTIQTLDANTTILSPSLSTCPIPWNLIFQGLINIFWNLHVPYQPLPFNGLASLPQSSGPINPSIMPSYCWPPISSSNNLSLPSPPISTVSMPRPRESVIAIQCSSSTLPPGPAPSSLPLPSCSPSPSTPSSTRLSPDPPPPRGVKRVFNEVDTNIDHPQAVKLQTKGESEELQGAGSNLLGKYSSQIEVENEYGNEALGYFSWICIYSWDFKGQSSYSYNMYW